MYKNNILHKNIGESSLDDCSTQVFPYNIFAYCSIYIVDCKFARNNNNNKIRNQHMFTFQYAIQRFVFHWLMACQTDNRDADYKCPLYF
jgi:hypothetical protein